ncbi:MAG TPA: metallophosphoesterase [Phycisphaerae bacterium]|nr:metallophosphoesterase [Phycisphaerae bacterium]
MPETTPTPANAHLKFPSVSTHLASRRSSNDYQGLGLPFPHPSTDCIMDLTYYFGPEAVNKIVSSGKFIFHMTGDTGVGSNEQKNVAEAMARDINNTNHELGPSCLILLGDIIYGSNKEAGYADKFYRIYDHYDRLIFAIPGNHDGEELLPTDPTTLNAFEANFCTPPESQPPLATEFGVLMPNQPGPHWHLKAPFVDILGLYSNSEENVGIISNHYIGHKQKIWLHSRLAAIAAARANGPRNALIIAVHHPPFARGFHSSGPGYPGSPEMLADIDSCCTDANILPDAVISAHTHNYQHYVRTQILNGKECTIPYLIVGTGGIGLQTVPAPTIVHDSTGTVFYRSAFKDYGYLTVTATAKLLIIQFNALVGIHRELREQITIDLATHKII